MNKKGAFINELDIIKDVFKYESSLLKVHNMKREDVLDYSRRKVCMSAGSYLGLYDYLKYNKGNKVDRMMFDYYTYGLRKFMDDEDVDEFVEIISNTKNITKRYEITEKYFKRFDDAMKYGAIILNSF